MENGTLKQVNIESRAAKKKLHKERVEKLGAIYFPAGIILLIELFRVLEHFGVLQGILSLIGK